MLDWLRREAPEIELGGKVLPVAIRRLSNAKRLTMRLAPDGSEVRISLPRWGRTAEALEFAQSRAAWLEVQLAKLAQPVAIGAGSALPFRGEQLRIEHVAARPRRPELLANALLIGGPEASLAPRLKRWLEGEARAMFTSDLAEYCVRAGQPVPKLALSSAQRRWGSCSSGGTIRLNWRLVMAPDYVRRSVVAHEVAHLVHMDHSPRFHALLDQLFEGRIEDANRWLARRPRPLRAVWVE
jgi:predicted metal-dependent hydrolase